MLVAKHMSRRPKMSNVWMRWLRAQNGAPPLLARGQRVVPPLQFIHALKIKFHAAQFTIDLHAICIFISRGHSTGLKAGHGAVAHARKKQERIIHGAGLSLGASLTFLRAQSQIF